MINLLPPSHKEQISFARRNTVLKNWVAASIIGVFGILVIIAVGYVFISQSTAVEQQKVQKLRDELGAQKLEETQKRVTEISDSVKLATQVLSKQVLFSKLLAQVGAAMPPNTALSTLTIGSLDGGIDLTAVATDYNAATQVQINLEDPNNKIFEKADIVNIACQDDTPETIPTTTTPESAAASRYPCRVTIRALFSKNNSFQYVSNGNKVKQQ